MNFEMATNRFNNESLEVNNRYKQNNNIDGVVYGSPLPIRDKFPVGGVLFVIEMNIDTNKIIGIGVIRNQINYTYSKSIYFNQNWNQFIYSGKYWLSREDLLAHSIELTENLEKCLFKGKSHLKRLSGITIITEKCYNRWEMNKEELKRSIKNLFLERFKK